MQVHNEADLKAVCLEPDGVFPHSPFLEKFLIMPNVLASVVIHEEKAASPRRMVQLGHPHSLTANMPATQLYIKTCIGIVATLYSFCPIPQRPLVDYNTFLFPFSLP